MGTSGLGVAHTVSLDGLATKPVVIEARVSSGLPGFTVLGIGGSVGRQSAARVSAALRTTGVNLTNRKVLVNALPADVDKRGARFDLAIAAAVLRAADAIEPGDETFLGELTLTGSVRSVAGVFPSLRSVRHAVVAAENSSEAILAGCHRVDAVESLGHLIAIRHGDVVPAREPIEQDSPVETALDLQDVVGQPAARRAVEIAAAGGHHLLLLGAPGTGKSMLAKRLPGILPPLTDSEAMDVAAVKSLTTGRARTLPRTAPFAAPHHSSSTSALLGGGVGIARPGAVSQASHGVLFLDELFEWSRRTLDALREPMEEGTVRLARSRGTVQYPARFLLVASANPCPCGPSLQGCRCGPAQVARYRARLTGPLADRFDLAPSIESVPAAVLASNHSGEPTATVRERVIVARGAAMRRGPWRNADAPDQVIRPTLTTAAVDVLVAAVDARRLTTRGFHRAARVGRTIADLAGSETVLARHAREAIAHRAALDCVWADAA